MSTSTENLEQRIRERAHSLWEAEGRPEGGADKYRERARALIQAEDNPESPSMVSPPAV